MPMQHLDADADAILKTAQVIARDYEQEHVGTEHVLLAILRQPGSLAARVLASLNVDEARGKKAIDDVYQKAKEDTWVLGRLPGTPNFKNVVARAVEEAQQLEAKSVGSEHLLLGLLRERGCGAERVLHALGVTLTRCREEIVRQLSA
ncbi:MAG: ATP-dependent Clp protease ATP-binding subunit ClpC [Phycisphaerae bacterium]|nr:ATP-dependent Clp protease ATP-binding subunit ClpC [Phycisphaerae bacterium]